MAPVNGLRWGLVNVQMCAIDKQNERNAAADQKKTACINSKTEEKKNLVIRINLSNYKDNQ